VSINFDESIRGIYYASLDEKTDWMLGINETDEHWVVQYRFRYYHSDNPWDAEDKKNWYSMKIDASEPLADVVAFVETMFERIEEEAEGDCYKLLRGKGTHAQFFEEFKGLPFVHYKVLSGDDPHPVDGAGPIEQT
jgi:hypothetical protein